jgi:hypothetical protein
MNFLSEFYRFMMLKGNLNPIDTTTDPDVGNAIIGYLEENFISPNILLKDDQLAVVHVNEARDILKASIASDKRLSTAKRMNFSFTMETMLVSCFFDDEQCSASDFKVRIIPFGILLLASKSYICI